MNQIPNMGDLYQVEAFLLQAMGLLPNIVQAYSPVAANKVRLVVVAGGDHWITVSPTELYDPADGTVLPYTEVNGTFTTQNGITRGMECGSISTCRQVGRRPRLLITGDYGITQLFSVRHAVHP